MMRSILSLYSPRYPSTLTYMLQSTEYQVKPYLAWINRTKDFGSVVKRRSLERTKAARMLLSALRIGMAVQIVIGLLSIFLGITHTIAGGIYFGLAIIILYPLFWGYAVTIPLYLGRVFIALPKERELITQSEAIFAKHPGLKIAVAGSYGKTTMKELLLTVLSEGMNVAATPANKNVAISHAYFARKLSGNEDALVIEYGEGAPGDVARFSRTTHPTDAVITGLAPAHLDHYKTLDAAGRDIFSLALYVDNDHLFVDDTTTTIKPYIQPGFQSFNSSGALGWKVTSVDIAITGTSFTLSKNKKTIKLHSGLVGAHQVSFLSFVAAFALQSGLSVKQVQAGIAKTIPFEHRMQPRQVSGAWVIDDTYNGNLEGIRVGTQLLADIPAGRKIYVTPGLVDQGEEKERVHVEVGKLIAKAHPDIVVLMQNSVTPYIERGLSEGKYSGDIRTEKNPLEFYTNLAHFVANGDLVVMQNDWTDNYA